MEVFFQTHGRQCSWNLSRALRDPVHKALSFLQHKRDLEGYYCAFILYCDLGWYYESEMLKESNRSLSSALKVRYLCVIYLDNFCFQWKPDLYFKERKLGKKGKNVHLSAGSPRKLKTKGPYLSISQHCKDTPKTIKYLTKSNWGPKLLHSSISATSSQSLLI